MLAGAHKKFYRIQHLEIYLLDLKVQYMKLPLDMVSKHVLMYLYLPDYIRRHESSGLSTVNGNIRNVRCVRVEDTLQFDIS